MKVIKEHKRAYSASVYLHTNMYISSRFPSPYTLIDYIVEHTGNYVFLLWMNVFIFICLPISCTRVITFIRNIFDSASLHLLLSEHFQSGKIVLVIPV